MKSIGIGQQKFVCMIISKAHPVFEKHHKMIQPYVRVSAHYLKEKPPNG